MRRAGVKLLQPSTAIAAVLLVTIVYLLALDVWRGRARQQVCESFSEAQRIDDSVLHPGDARIASFMLHVAGYGHNSMMHT